MIKALTGKKSKSGNKSKNKWTLTQFIVWGFNMIVGYAFVIGLNKSFSPVGNLIPIVIIIGAIIAFITGYSFGRLSNKFASNGGTYLYCKRTFGKKTAFFAGFFQYIQAPMVALAAFFGMLWAFLGLGIIHSSGSAIGNLQNLWWVGFIAAILYLGSYLVTSYGFTATKYTLWFLYVVKWGVLIFSIILAFIGIQHFGEHIGASRNGANIRSFTVPAFIGSIFTFFFAFGGFESIAIVAEDVENPRKNMLRALVVIICLTTLFYLFYFYVILGALGAGFDPHSGAITFREGVPGGSRSGGPIPDLTGQNGTDFNAINQLLIVGLGTKFRVLNFAGGAVVTVVLILVVVSQLANKTTSRLMNGWVNARTIAVIAHDGFLPVELSAKNKYNQFKRTLAIDALISIVLVVIFYPIYLATSYNIADTIDLYTISAFIQYLFVLAATIKVWKEEKKASNINTFEVIFYAIIFVVLVFLLVEYFIAGIISGITAFQEGSSADSGYASDIGVFVSAITYIILLSLAGILYRVGKSRGWHAQGIDKEVDYAKHHDLTDLEVQPNL